MHAKYEVSISNGSKVIAKVKVHNTQTDKQTDRQTNRQTGQKQYAPDHSIRGHKNILQNTVLLKITDKKCIILRYGDYSANQSPSTTCKCIRLSIEVISKGLEKFYYLHTCHIFLGPFWDFLACFLGQMTFFWDKYFTILGHILGHFGSVK